MCSGLRMPARRITKNRVHINELDTVFGLELRLFRRNEDYNGSNSLYMAVTKTSTPEGDEEMWVEISFADLVQGLSLLLGSEDDDA